MRFVGREVSGTARRGIPAQGQHRQQEACEKGWMSQKRDYFLKANLPPRTQRAQRKTELLSKIKIHGENTERS
jgi:hypothetical protein